MAILNMFEAKFTLTEGVPVELYSCPEGKSHAFLDATFFRDLIDTDTFVEIGLSTKSSPTQLNSLDFFLDDIEMAGGVHNGELCKLVVGAGERVYARVWQGEDVNVRVTGVEETNPLVLRAGRLGAKYATEDVQEVIFENDLAGTAYTACSVTVYNPDENETADVEIWVSKATTPDALDKIARFPLSTEDSAIIESVILAPGDKVICRSSIDQTEFFVNGMVTGAV